MISNLTKNLHRNVDIINDDKIINSHDKQSRIERIFSKLNVNKMLKVTYKMMIDNIKNEPKNEEKARCLLRKALFLNNETNDNLAIVMDKLDQAIIESGFGGPTFVHAYCQRSKCNIKLGKFEAALLDIDIAIKYGGQNDERSFTRSLAIFYKNLKHFFPSFSGNPDWNEIRTYIENINQSSWKCLWDFLTNDKFIPEERCDQMSQLNDLEKLFKFQYNFKIDSRCAIVNDEKKGRHFICQNLIPKGTKVLVERAYSIAFEKRSQLGFCLHCCKECNEHFVPCRYCRMAVFCNEECFHRAWSVFHRHECLVLSVFNRDQLNMAIHMYRMITRIGVKNALIIKRHIDGMKNNQNLSQKIEKNWNKSVGQIINEFVIEQYIDDEKLRNTSDFLMKSSQKNRTYQMMLTLLDHNEKYESYYDMNYIGLAIDTALILLMNNYLIRNQSNKKQFSLPHWAHLPKILLKKIIKENADKEFINELNIFNHSYKDFAQLVEILLYNIRKLTTNIFSWNNFGRSGNGQNVATCQCLIGSLINHSCKPNVEWEFENGCIIYTASRDINPGEEITNSYGPHPEMAFIKRQTLMAQNYYFNCRCEICRIEVDHYPNVLRCQNCSGPAVVIPESTINSECMNCWQSYENAAERMDYVNGSFRKFFAIQMIIQDECHSDTKDMWLEKMQKCLQDQRYHLYGKNPKLMENFKIACRLHFDHGKFDIACDLASQLNEIDEDFFSLSIDSDEKKSRYDWIKAIENQRLFYDIGKMYLQQQQQTNNKFESDQTNNNEQDLNNNHRVIFATKIVDTYHGYNIFLFRKLFNSLIANDE